MVLSLDTPVGCFKKMALGARDKKKYSERDRPREELTGVVLCILDAAVF